MKIAVLNCPLGISLEGVAQALRDAGLPQRDFQGKKSVAQIAKALKRAGVQKCFVRNLGIGRKGDPRTLKLLKGFILERVPLNKEIVNRDGAALLARICEKTNSIPSMRLERVGFGPNRLMVSIGEPVAPFRRERVLLLETNIDDMSPQGFELLYERLFKGGALDVWVQSILMKKMRPAFKISVLLEHKDQERISEIVFKETPSLGVRFLELDRFSLPRKRVRVKTRFGPVRMKIGFLDSKFSTVRPEYEDVKRIAHARNLPFQEVYEECVRKGERL
jgi:uncharacterized protein (DUF111 family)